MSIWVLQNEMTFLQQAFVLCGGLQTELQIFFNEKIIVMSFGFHSKAWMLKVYYRNMVFLAVNDLNSSMQCRNQNITTLSEKLFTFKKKLQLLNMKFE